MVRKMTCEQFYELLDKIKNKPGMYIGTKSIIKLKHFLDGILYAFYITWTNKMKQIIFYKDFRNGFK